VAVINPPPQEANPHRGSDKHMRTNAVADLFKSGLV
jgi:hypothetical protein